MKKKFPVMLLILIVIFSFHYFVSKKIDLINYSSNDQGNYLRIQDFSYHIIVAKSFWFEGFGNIYDYEFQKKALSKYIDSEFNLAMPIGVTPIFLLIVFPFAYVSTYSMEWSFTLWVSFSSFVVTDSIWRVIKNYNKKNKLSIIWIILFLILVFSFTTISAICKGQTSIIGTGLLIFLIFLIVGKNEDPERNKKNSYKIIIVTIFMAIKPNYAILGLGLLMIYGMWRETIYSIMYMILIFIAISPLLGCAWPFPYMETIKMINSGNLPEHYAWTYAPRTMNNFRTAFKGIVEDNILVKLSNIITFIVYIFVFVFSIYENKIKNKRHHILFDKISKEQAFILLISSYLLFASYAGAYEDFLFLGIFVYIFIFCEKYLFKKYEIIVLFLSLAFVTSQGLFINYKPTLLLWFLKTVIMIIFFQFCPKKCSVPK